MYLRCKNIQVLNYLMTGSWRVMLFEVTGEDLCLDSTRLRSRLSEEPPVPWGTRVGLASGLCVLDVQLMEPKWGKKTRIKLFL